MSAIEQVQQFADEAEDRPWHDAFAYGDALRTVLAVLTCLREEQAVADTREAFRAAYDRAETSIRPQEYLSRMAHLDTELGAASRRTRAALFAATGEAPLSATDAALHRIAAERARQVRAEGWTPAHDDAHADGALAAAAACYALPPGARGHQPLASWPFEATWWKPTPEDRARELVKAGALLVAELERLERAAATVAVAGG